MMNLEKTVLGIELGSTRIKAVLIDEKHIPIAQGDYEWENQLVNGVWTYSMDAVHTGLQTCFANLKADVKAKLGAELTTVGAIGVSAMMHGYLPFDKEGRQLAEFRTWRNTITCEGHRFPHHPCRLYPLAADRREGYGDRRGLRHVPHRQRKAGL